MFGFGEEEDVAEHFEIFKTFWKQMVGFRVRDQATAPTPVFPGVDFCQLPSLSVSFQVTPSNIHMNCSESKIDFSLIIDIFRFSIRCCCGANFEVFPPMQRRCPSNNFRRQV